MKFCCRLCIKFGSEDLRVIKIHTVAWEWPTFLGITMLKSGKKSQDDNFYLKKIKKSKLLDKMIENDVKKSYVLMQTFT